MPHRRAGGARGGMPPGVHGGGWRILVVDDDEDIRALVALALGDAGYAVDAAADGLQALRMARLATPDAIVLDLAMPLMGGEDFLYAWRAGVEASSVPVVAISAAAREIRPEELGVAAFVPKPFDVEVLVRAVGGVLASAPKSVAPPTAEARTAEVGEILDDLAHQLSALLGAAELLADDSSLPGHLRTPTTAALDAAQRASRTVRRLRHLIAAAGHQPRATAEEA